MATEANGMVAAGGVEGEEDEDGGDERLVQLGNYAGKVRIVEDPAEEIMLLWGIQQPTLSRHNAFVSQSSLSFRVDACGHSLLIHQSPSSLGTPGVTGSVMWDSGIILGKFLENAIDSRMLPLRGKKVVELGSGCGLVGCITALLGAQVILTDMPDRLRLLRKNLDANLGPGNLRDLTSVNELIWGDDPDSDLFEPLPDYIFGSDVIYGEGGVMDLIATLDRICGRKTTIILAGELRNDAILEYFLEAAIEHFVVGRVDQTHWHPDYRSRRVVMYILEKK